MAVLYFEKSPLYGRTLSILGKSSFHVGIVFLEKVNLVLLVQWGQHPRFLDKERKMFVLCPRNIVSFN